MPATSVQPRVRKSSIARKAEIIAASTRLFRERGYSAVGVIEIGNAVGLAGHSIYRHFPSKEAILAEIIGEVLEAHAPALAEAREAPDAYAALEVLIAARIAAFQRYPDATVIWDRDAVHLPKDVRERLDTSAAEFHQAWGEYLVELRPELDLATVAEMIGSTIVMLAAVAVNDSQLPDDERAALLLKMGMTALLGTGLVDLRVITR